MIVPSFLSNGRIDIPSKVVERIFGTERTFGTEGIDRVCLVHYGPEDWERCRTVEGSWELGILLPETGRAGAASPAATSDGAARKRNGRKFAFTGVGALGSCAIVHPVCLFATR